MIRLIAHAGDVTRAVAIVAACGLLVTFPFSHTVALRNVLLGIGCLAAVAHVLRHPRTWPAGFLSLIALWGLLGALSLTWSVDRPYSLQELQTEFVHSVLVFLLFHALSSAATIDHFRRALLGATVLSFVSAGYWACCLPRDSTGFFFNGPGMYTTFLVGALPFALAWTLDPRIDRATRIVNGCVAAGILLAAAPTLNRLFWLIALLQAGLLCVLLRRSRADAGMPWRRLAVVAASVAMAGAVLFTTVTAVRIALIPGDATSVSQLVNKDPRRDLWPLAVSRIAESPWTGAGFGRGILREELQQRFGQSLVWHAHNVVLNYGLALGIPGILLILAMFGQMLRASWRLDRASLPTGPYRDAFIVAMLGILGKNMFDDFFYREGAMFLWALTGIATGVVANAAGRKQPAR